MPNALRRCWYCGWLIVWKRRGRPVCVICRAVGKRRTNR